MQRVLQVFITSWYSAAHLGANMKEYPTYSLAQRALQVFITSWYSAALLKANNYQRVSFKSSSPVGIQRPF
jgi:hypothetical protein